VSEISRESGKLRREWAQPLPLIGMLAVWQISAMLVNDSLVLPSFTDVVSAFGSSWGDIFFRDLPVSLLHFFLGIFAGMIIAMPLGMGMGWSRSVDRIVDPIIEVVRPIPPLAWIPFAIVWFGLTHESAGFIVFIGAVFPILINTYVGFRNLPRVYVESAMVLGATRDRDLIRYVALPYALPSIAAGIRIAMGIAWMCLVAAEMFGVSTSGLGYRIWSYYYLHKMDHVLLYMIVLGMLGLFIDKAFRGIIEDRLLRWRVGLTQ